jgi:serine/threonine protein kinase
VRGLQAGDPQRVGPYRIIGRLGAGGMGVVFAGRSEGGRLVAVKIVRSELADDPNFRVRFSREVAAARSVSGLFTAPVVDADLDGPVPWLATAYVAGPSLAEAVRAHGPLPVPSLLGLAAGLAEGLRAIHRAGLVHRDLKPANVLLAEDGPRVIDFGISRAAEATALTSADLVIGSPGFMSPEQAEGRLVGPESDVFSLGAVVAFAAAGQGPFGTGSVAALVYRVVHDSPDLSGIPEPIGSLVGRCLAKDPVQRPTTAELLAELDGADLTAGWLPAAFAAEFSQRATVPGISAPGGRTVTGSARLSLASAAPEEDPPTVTAARPDQRPSRFPAPPGPGQPTVRPGGASRRRRKIMLLAVGILAVSAGTGTGIGLATGNPAAGQGHPSSSAALTTQESVAAVPPPRASASSSPSVTGQPTSPADARPPVAPSNVTATALDEYTIRVTWIDRGNGITGFNVTNGCGADGCSGGALNVRTGLVTAADVRTTPGAYQCFSVQALSPSGISASASMACTSTPAMNIPVTRQWTDTGVTVKAGASLGISASGDVYVAAVGSSQPPAGNPACTPRKNYPADSASFPASRLPCWSLIARIGNSPPFEVGASILVSATSGRLYLGVNSASVSGNAGIWMVKIKIGGLP